MAPPRTPGYLLHKPTGQARVIIDGRTIYLGKHGTAESWAEYHRILSEWVKGRPPEPLSRRQRASSVADRLTVVELLDRFLTHAAARYEGGKEVSRYRLVCRTLAEVCGRSPADEFAPIHLREYRRRLIEQGRNRAVVNRLANAAKLVMRWGVCEGLIPPVITDRLDKLPALRAGEEGVRERQRRRALRLGDVERTLTHLPPVLVTMVRVQLLTAMRSGEVCAMRPVDIDTTGRVWWYTPESHKNAHRQHERRIPLIPAVQDLLRPYLARPIHAHLFAPAEAEGWYRERRRAERVTPANQGNGPGRNAALNRKRPPGQSYSTPSYSKAIGWACRRAWPAPKGITAEQRAEWHREHRWSPNLLRHTAAQVVRDQFGAEVAALVCGHRSSSVTESHYAEVNAARAAEVLSEIQDRLALAI